MLTMSVSTLQNTSLFCKDQLPCRRRADQGSDFLSACFIEQDAACFIEEDDCNVVPVLLLAGNDEPHSQRLVYLKNLHLRQALDHHVSRRIGLIRLIK